MNLDYQFIAAKRRVVQQEVMLARPIGINGYRIALALGSLPATKRTTELCAGCNEPVDFSFMFKEEYAIECAKEKINALDDTHFAWQYREHRIMLTTFSVIS